MIRESLLKVWTMIGLVLSLFLFAHLTPSLSRNQTASALNILAETKPEAQTPPRLVNGGIALDLSAQAWLSAYLAPDGQTAILTEKNADEHLPIASITKLVTALLAPRDSPLLYPLLIESNNAAAVILANQVAPAQFVNEMNKLVTKLGLSDTHFYNPNGLDPEASTTDQAFNYSTAHDLLRLAEHLIATRPDLLQISTLRQYSVATSTGLTSHLALNTDQLLDGEPWSSDIVGGKTGSTDLAKKNLLLILHAPNHQGYLVNIVLGSGDNFAATTNLVDWVRQSYEF